LQEEEQVWLEEGQLELIWLELVQVQQVLWLSCLESLRVPSKMTMEGVFA